MKGLTKRQREIVDYIKEYIGSNSYSPSYREIMEQFGFSSVGSVYKHVKALERKGFLSLEKGCSRSIALVEEGSIGGDASVELPFIGTVTAGQPIEMFEQTSSITVPSVMVSSLGQCYILRVRGDSLINDHINDGDLIIVEAKQNPDPGELVLAIIHNNETVIKRCYPEGLYTRLEAIYSDTHPITLKHDEVFVQGCVVSLLRMYS
ncbi:MAG: repressor LexA [Waddliaceae bacterium]|jgi:repressor LexA|nr:repressor LexA [Waddliaceae bacterium]MBT3578429.1 repressor LexA [Waddliaceae bacterium]MBT4445120.1 repressor LexA [Waddliaceae bacterium]MBT6929121.1 repressor LexA [Waddliaceae bacterium]MBT7264620.1 repressor LexA [Waddliaceae bacterium]